MHRLGFWISGHGKTHCPPQNQQQVKVRSIFSHLAGADEPKFDSFTKEQIERFTACADQITSFFASYHASYPEFCRNWTLPQYQFDMVRLGIGHYGISSIPDAFKPVCALKTIILQIKQLKPEKL